MFASICYHRKVYKQLKVLFGYSIGNFFHRYFLASRSCYFVHCPTPTFCLVLVYLNAPRINGSRVFLRGSVLHSPNLVVCGVSNIVLAEICTRTPQQICFLTFLLTFLYSPPGYLVPYFCWYFQV